MDDSYIYVIVALLPLAACLVVFQANPYHALIVRGILGAVAALVYAVLGAADVALTEALVGTMLAITLYAVAVRSSLVMRLGVLENRLIDGERNSSEEVQSEDYFNQLMNDLRRILQKYYMRLELVPYLDSQSLHQALIDQEIHATCVKRSQLKPDNQSSENLEEQPQIYQTTTRIRRIYEIMQPELSSSPTVLTYVNVPDVKVPVLQEDHS